MSSEKIEKLIRMLNDLDYRMRAIRKLEALGAEAESAVLPLWQNIVLDTDGNPPEDMRASALNAIASITGGTLETIQRLLDRLDPNKEPSWVVRKQAAQSLMNLGVTEPWVMSRLTEYLKSEYNFEVGQAIIRIMIQFGDQEKLFASAREVLQNFDQGTIPFSLRVGLLILVEMELSEEQKAETLQAMWDFLRQQNTGLEQVFDAILEISSDDDQILELLLSDDGVTLTNKSMVITNYKLLEHITPQFKKANEPILSILLEAVRSTDDEISLQAQMRLIDILNDCPTEISEKVLNTAQNFLMENGRGLRLLFVYKPEIVKDWISKDQPVEYKSHIGYFLLEDAPDLLDELWDGDDLIKVILLGYVLAILNENGDWQKRDGYLNWLREKILDIPAGSVEPVKMALQPLKQETESDENIAWWARRSVDTTFALYQKRSSELEEERLSKEIKDGKAVGDELVKKIKAALSMGSADLLRALVAAWVHWVIYDEQPSIVDTTADAFRYTSLAVLPLVDQLAKDIPLDGRVLNEIREQNPRLAGLISELKKSSQVKLADEMIVREWLKSHDNRSDTFVEAFQNAKDQAWPLNKQVEAIIQLLERERQLERRLKKNRRITKQLADMSDERFFGIDREEEYKRVKKVLADHAIPVLARMLPNETDTDIRENLARTLGNIGGREAVDALVRAVVEEEKKRNARQELLATYYLEPSKKQSEEAASILSAAVNEAKSTLRMLQGLNILVFLAGMILLLTGVLTSLWSEDTATRLIGSMAGIGGLAGVIVQLVKNPLDRIQNAMANLVQIETAFTSFIWELNLNGTYIQSQYVAEGILTNDEIMQTVNRIENAMSLAMNLVAVYTEEGRQRLVTRINNLSPAAGDANSQVTIHGQHLQGDSSQKKERSGIIAINHTPIQPTDLTWTEDTVRFKLPAALPGLEGNAGTLWVSLLIDGMETNALPFYLINDGQ